MTMPRTRRSGVLARRPPIARHQFAVGDAVLLTNMSAVDAARGLRFAVVATMPHRDGSLQYRIRDQAEKFDRVASENMLEAAPLSTAATDDAAEPFPAPAADCTATGAATEMRAGGDQ
jgi:hypothetical protein